MPNVSKEYGLLLAKSSPLNFVTRPEITLRRVVFPAPDEPMMAVSSPALNMPETSYKMVFVGEVC